MQTRTISNFDVSVLGLGCNQFGWRVDAATSTAIVHRALDEGITFFDTADVYADGHSERILGRALGHHRKDIIIATKFGSLHRTGTAQHPTPFNIAKALEESLRRLRTDYIDLYQLHAPNPLIPTTDILHVLQTLVNAGKLRAFGCCNFSADHLSVLLPITLPSFVTLQAHYNLLFRMEEHNLLPLCRTAGLGFIPYYPLACGLLSGKYSTACPKPPGSRAHAGLPLPLYTMSTLRTIDSLTQFATSCNRSLLELALSWLLSYPAVVSIPVGVTSPRHVTENARATLNPIASSELTSLNSLLTSLPTSLTL